MGNASDNIAFQKRAISATVIIVVVSAVIMLINAILDIPARFYDSAVERSLTQSEIGVALIDGGIEKITASLTDEDADCSNMLLSVKRNGVLQEVNFEHVKGWPKVGEQCVSLIKLTNSHAAGDDNYHLFIDGRSSRSYDKADPVEMAKFVSSIGNIALMMHVDKQASEKEIAEAFKVNKLLQPTE